jgi:hypothetical protein
MGRDFFSVLICSIIPQVVSNSMHSRSIEREALVWCYTDATAGPRMAKLMQASGLNDASSDSKNSERDATRPHVRKKKKSRCVRNSEKPLPENAIVLNPRVTTQAILPDFAQRCTTW